jgi:hypothetical protein
LKRRQREKWDFRGSRGCFALFRLLEAKMRFGSAGPDQMYGRLWSERAELSMCPADNKHLSIYV